MNESRFFKKVLTPAEVGNTGTHEKYIRLTNDFDFKSFYQQEGEINGSVREFFFEAKDLSVGHENDNPISFKFVYYENSNKEKRLPSLGALYNSHNIQEGDVIILESRTSDGNTEFFFSHIKAGEITLNPSTIYYTEKEAVIIHAKVLKDVVLQQIYYGAPGTGKSHRIKKQLEELNVPKGNIFRTTFHPDSDYSSFVGAYKPTMKKQYRYDGKVKAKYYEDDDLAGAKRDDVIIDKVIQYDFIPQTFIKAYTQAYKNPNENVYLIIEEINRGNCAQIFGDLFQLLDRDDNGVSEYPIKADSDLKMYLEGELGKNHDGIKDGELCLPSNLYIWATMNTSDQSLFPIDSAFKRRWDWEYEPIKYMNTDWGIEVGGNMYSWTSFQKEVNNRIFEATNSEDKMLGDFFVKPNNNVISEKQFINKVLFYLWNDVCKDGDGDIFKTEDNKDVKFSDLYDTNASVTLKSMMKNLGVSIIETEDIEEFMEDSNSDDFNNISSMDNSQQTLVNSMDYSKFSINNNGQYSKGAVVYEVIKLYCDEHKELNAEEIVRQWLNLGIKVPHLVETESIHAIRKEKTRDSRFDDKSKKIQLANGQSIFVSNQFNVERITDFITKVNAQDWNIRIEKV